MSDITNNPTKVQSIAEQLRLEDEAAAELQKKLDAVRIRREELQKQQEEIRNNPVERAKLFVDANKMIEEAIEQYKTNGYSCIPVKDENGLFIKIVFKNGKSGKSGTRGPRKKAGDTGHIPAMTRDHFVGIYTVLGKEFKNQNIVEALVKKFGENGKYTDFRTQPSLGSILNNGYEGIKIEKVGTQGRNVYYKKIS